MLKLNIGRRGLRTIVTTVGSYHARTKVKPTNEWMGCCVGTYAPNCTLLSSTRVLSVRTAVVLLRKAVRALCLFSLVRLARNVVCRRRALLETLPVVSARDDLGRVTCEHAGAHVGMS